MSTTPTHRPSPRRLVAGLVLSAVLLGTVALSDPASAGTPQAPRPPKVAFTATGTGTWGMHSSGNGDLVARSEEGILSRRGREKPPVKVAATVGTDDRTLPAPGECEHAIATFSVWREHGKRFDDIVIAIGDGELCGHQPEGDSTLVYSYVGRFEVYDGRQALIGVDGFEELLFFAGGEAYLFATDS